MPGELEALLPTLPPLLLLLAPAAVLPLLLLLGAAVGERLLLARRCGLKRSVSRSTYLSPGTNSCGHTAVSDVRRMHTRCIYGVTGP